MRDTRGPSFRASVISAQIGFWWRRAVVYMTLVERGPLTLHSLAPIIGVDQTDLYRIIEDLRQNKLIARTSMSRPSGRKPDVWVYAAVIAPAP